MSINSTGAVCPMAVEGSVNWRFELFPANRIGSSIPLPPIRQLRPTLAIPHQRQRAFNRQTSNHISRLSFLLNSSFFLLITFIDLTVHQLTVTPFQNLLHRLTSSSIPRLPVTIAALRGRVQLHSSTSAWGTFELRSLPTTLKFSSARCQTVPLRRIALQTRIMASSDDDVPLMKGKMNGVNGSTWTMPLKQRGT